VGKFVFELEAVLTQRRAEEREKQLVVGAFERERLGVEGAIREAHEGIEREQQELRALSSGTINAVDLKRQASAALSAVNRAQALVLRLAGVQKRLDAARLELLLAATRRKAVENLRERRYEQWLLDEKHKEGRALDELVVMRRRTQTSEAGVASPGEEAA
jgi:flagellar export protein FliJ